MEVGGGVKDGREGEVVGDGGRGRGSDMEGRGVSGRWRDGVMWKMEGGGGRWREGEGVGDGGKEGDR